MLAHTQPLNGYEAQRLESLRAKRNLCDNEIREFQRLASQALQALRHRRMSSSYKPKALNPSTKG
jgi:hypothetical protein